jgi:hypothetical protein
MLDGAQRVCGHRGEYENTVPISEIETRYETHNLSL